MSGCACHPAPSPASSPAVAWRTRVRSSCCGNGATQTSCASSTPRSTQLHARLLRACTPTATAMARLMSSSAAAATVVVCARTSFRFCLWARTRLTRANGSARANRNPPGAGARFAAATEGDGQHPTLDAAVIPRHQASLNTLAAQRHYARTRAQRLRPGGTCCCRRRCPNAAVAAAAAANTPQAVEGLRTAACFQGKWQLAAHQSCHFTAHAHCSDVCAIGDVAHGLCQGGVGTRRYGVEAARRQCGRVDRAPGSAAAAAGK
jgi:hypothetical protein